MIKRTEKITCFDVETGRYFMAESINQVHWFVERLNNYIVDQDWGNIMYFIYFDELFLEFDLPAPEYLDRIFMDNMPKISEVVMVSTEHNGKPVVELRLIRKNPEKKERSTNMRDLYVVYADGSEEKFEWVDEESVKIDSGILTFNEGYSTDTTSIPINQIKKYSLKL